MFGVPVTVGRLFALASIPFMVALYFLMRLPRFPGVMLGIQEPLVLAISADESAA